MARKVVNTMRKAKGSTGRWLRRWGFMVSLALATGAGVILLAVHDAGVFELEGNAVVDTAGLHDWDQVFTDHNNGNLLASGAKAVSFGVDGSGSASIFTG